VSVDTRVPRLTVAIPTFNRRDALLGGLDQAFADGLAGVASVLVIDDGSTDGTEAAIRERQFGEAVSYVRHDTNQGYARTYLEVFQRCQSQHLMLSSDDDHLAVDGIRALVETSDYLDTPVTSTVFLTRDGTVYRGRQRFSHVTPGQLRAAMNHAPGIVYETEVARSYLAQVGARVDAGCSMAATYPQVLLGLLIAMDHPIAWVPVTTVREGARLPSGITDREGRSYGSARSRLAQLLDFDGFLTDGIDQAKSNRGRDFARGVLRAHRRHALPRLLSSIGRDTPDLARELTRQASLLPFGRPGFTFRAWVRVLPGRRGGPR
jgi:hypothetical protein